MGKSKLSIVMAIVVLGIVTYLVMNHKIQRKVGFVLIKELYNGFEMKKEMERTYLQVKRKHDRVLDSARFELNRILKRIEVENEKNPKTIAEFKKQKEAFYQTKNAFEEENEKLSQRLDEQILTQLNQYVKDYAVVEHYDLLFGSDGNGSIMFATDDLNRTKDVLNFINQKYNGTR